MSVVSTANDLATIDWNIVAGATATFLVTGLITWLGLRKGKEKASEPSKSDITSVVGASLIENATIKELSRSLRETAEAVRDNTREVQENTREVRDLKEEQRRCNDLTLMTNKRNR